MTDKDTQMLTEAYQQVEEGMFDRFRARGAQAVGAVKGAGQQLAGAAQQAFGKGVSAVGAAVDKGAQKLGYVPQPGSSGSALSQYGQTQQAAANIKTQAGQRAGDVAKYQSYINSASQGLVTDLEKLNMPVDDSAALLQDIKDLLAKHLTQVSTKTGQFIQPGVGAKEGVVKTSKTSKAKKAPVKPTP